MNHIAIFESQNLMFRENQSMKTATKKAAKKKAAPKKKK
jgi:hydroxyacyl-ACP dehydratase HTD2-like protein with hotdog domain